MGVRSYPGPGTGAPHRQAWRLLACLWALAVLTLLAACAAPRRALPTPTPWPTPIVAEKPTYVVQRGTVIDQFALSGQVAPEVWEPLYFTVDGRLAALKVAEGIAVQQGDLLAELEMASLHEQLAQAQLGLEQAQDQLARQENSRRYALERARLNLSLQQLTLQELRRAYEQGRPLELAQAQTELERARLNLERAQSAYDAVAWQPGAGASVQANALQAATFEYQLAEARHKLRLLGDGESQVARQEIQVKLAELAVQELAESSDPDLQRNVTRVQMQIQALERQIKERRLRAPFTGQVIAVGLGVQGLGAAGNARPQVGDAVPAFSPLAVVARPEPLEVVVDATRGRALELYVGQAVTITHGAAPGRPFVARIAAIPVASLDQRAELKEGPRVRIALPAARPPLSIGDYVQVQVVAAVHSDTLFLPPAAVRRFGGRSFVVVQEGERRRRIAIAIGLENETQIEIVSGLREGDVVIGP